MSEFKPVRGMRDFLSEDSMLLRFLEDRARKVAQLYRFSEIITPVVESYELLAAKAGEEVKSRMFAFKDLGGRTIALRPEFTASVARLVATTLRNEPRPFRMFSVGSVYRYDEPQRGRYREIWQTNFELMGSSRPEADAEILLLTNSLMTKAGVKDYAFKIGHVGVLRGILRQERLDEKIQNQVMQLMDKKQYDDATNLVISAGVPDKCVKVLQELVGLKGEDVFGVLSKMRECVKNYEEAIDALDNLHAILTLLSESGCKISLTIDAGFARGLEYYTGFIFEIYVPNLDLALGGGGRYDKLVELFGGEPTFAVGVAHGIDRIMLVLHEQKGSFEMAEHKSAVIIPINAQLRGAALKIACLCRDAGVTVETEVMGRKMAKALEDADRKDIDYAVIVGEREIKEDAVMLRNLKKREQSVVKIEKLVGAIRS